MTVSIKIALRTKTTCAFCQSYGKQFVLCAIIVRDVLINFRKMLHTGEKVGRIELSPKPSGREKGRHKNTPQFFVLMWKVSVQGRGYLYIYVVVTVTSTCLVHNNVITSWWHHNWRHSNEKWQNVTNIVYDTQTGWCTRLNVFSVVPISYLGRR